MAAIINDQASSVQVISKGWLSSHCLSSGYVRYKWLMAAEINDQVNSAPGMSKQWLAKPLLEQWLCQI